MGNPAFGAAALELGPKVLINDTHQENAGIAVDAGENGIDMMQAANKGPNMFGRPDIGKLRDTGAGHLMHGFTRRIGYQMKVEQAVRHARKNRTVDGSCHEISLQVPCGKAVPKWRHSGDGSRAFHGGCGLQGCHPPANHMGKTAS